MNSRASCCPPTITRARYETPTATIFSKRKGLGEAKWRTCAHDLNGVEAQSLALEHFHQALIEILGETRHQLLARLTFLCFRELDVREAAHVQGVERAGTEL